MKNNEPIWFNKPGAVTEINIGHREPKYKIFVATPVHSEVSIHYTQALLKFQQVLVYWLSLEMTCAGLGSSSAISTSSLTIKYQSCIAC